MTNKADAEGIRLQKVLSTAGVASRRAAEELIVRGRVRVDGEKARLGQRVHPESSVIHVDGKRIITDVKTVHFALNKPRGVVCSMDDEKGRQSLAEYVTGVDERIFHVGRLDTDSEGLLLLTNDGELANRIMHPSWEVEKTYRCQVRKVPDGRTIKRILHGIELDDGLVKADKFRIIDEAAGQSLIEITLHEGRKHVVRRLMDRAGHPVSRLVRTEIGPIRLQNLKPGTLRKLRPDEIGQLYRQVGL
ncbi:pseudouridine synthase [Natronoglycomyces albus]|uniref:Pseudouridine synthase n=1 Tax=Natronoglycomyces albus TaxID=2811108 RepID=A0A895XNG2_9ACTN|nr:pseudouridine synthase [Natronoglycomyces albus]QSB03850.1 rRNA pseudouridine synthase [Natronoglycomyces albus]